MISVALSMMVYSGIVEMIGVSDMDVSSVGSVGGSDSSVYSVMEGNVVSESSGDRSSNEAGAESGVSDSDNADGESVSGDVSNSSESGVEGTDSGISSIDDNVGVSGEDDDSYSAVSVSDSNVGDSRVGKMSSEASVDSETAIEGSSATSSRELVGVLASGDVKMEVGGADPSIYIVPCSSLRSNDDGDAGSMS